MKSAPEYRITGIGRGECFLNNGRKACSTASCVFEGSRTKRKIHFPLTSRTTCVQPSSSRTSDAIGSSRTSRAVDSRVSMGIGLSTYRGGTGLLLKRPWSMEFPNRGIQIPQGKCCYSWRGISLLSRNHKVDVNAQARLTVQSLPP